jgi:GTP:adenosylcobinamide-phosphate guanylyltransferase
VSLPVIVLAGERPGGNPLAQHFGTPAGILVDVAGTPCVTRVLGTLRDAEQTGPVLMVGPAAGVAEQEPMRGILSGHGARWLEPSTGPAESAQAALEAIDEFPVLITSADHALLTPAIVDDFVTRALAQPEDFLVGLVPHDRVKAAFPHSRRTLLRFADGTWCGSNLFLVRTAAGGAAVAFWRRMQQHRKRPWRMARELGPTTLLGYLAGRLTLGRAISRISDLAGCRIGFVALNEARAAVDVDSVADHALAEEILSAC